MEIFHTNDTNYQIFYDDVDSVMDLIKDHAPEEEIKDLQSIKDNFKMKVDDFYRENRKLNIGVVGQVKAGKSSFLNTLLFDGQEVLPKASTPKTATLTKMEYSEENIIQIEYYSKEEWEVLEDNSKVDLDDEIYTSAREIINMVRHNGIEPMPYLEKGKDRIQFDTYDDLIDHLNDYVGEDGKYTPLVKAVTLYLNKEEFKGLSIVDTPGLNDPIASRTIRTKEFMEVCDVVFFLSQAGSFLDKSDWTLLSSQLPQKGVNRLVLIASKYDSGIRDVLRVHNEEDDLFGEDENTADNIPKACKIIKRKLKKRAKGRVSEFVKDLERRGSSKELRDVIEQCSNPIMVSSIAHNMCGKEESDYSSEEKNIYAALKKFSKDIGADLELLGNFDEVQKLFAEVVAEKEEILQQKAKGFVPNAMEEVKDKLRVFKEKTDKRVQILENNDKEQLQEQRSVVEKQIGNIRTDIAEMFGELSVRLETEKANATKEIRQSSKEYSALKERTGTNTWEEERVVSDAKWYNPFTWFSSHVVYDTHTEHYSYCLAADAIENLKKYSIDATNQVEQVFTDALQLKEIKRKLLNVVINNFDMGSEKYDVSLFRIMVEDTVSMIEFPVFSIDLGDAVGDIAAQFTGEITDTEQKTELSTAISKAITKIYDKICENLVNTVRSYKESLAEIRKKVEGSMLEDIVQEFDNLVEQCENKEKEIQSYKEYSELLENSMQKLN